jgi:hypothetical protein
MTPPQKGIHLLQHPFPLVPTYSKFVYGLCNCEVRDWALDSTTPKEREVGEEIKMPKFCDSNGCTDMTTYLEKYCLNTTQNYPYKKYNTPANQEWRV